MSYSSSRCQYQNNNTGTIPFIRGNIISHQLDNNSLIHQSPISLSPLCDSRITNNSFHNSPINFSPNRSSPIYNSSRSSPVRSSPIHNSSPIRNSPIQNSPLRYSPNRSSPARSSPIRNSPNIQNMNNMSNMNNRRSLRIGVDYGNVCSSDSEGYEGNTGNEYAINVPNCLETLLKLKAEGHTLYLISFCGAARARATKAYFDNLHNNPFSGLYFVKDREYKKYICQKLGIDVMIDDRSDVLSTITDTMTLQFNQYNDTNVPRRGRFNPNFRANNWPETYNSLNNINPLGLQPENSLDTSKYCYN